MNPWPLVLADLRSNRAGTLATLLLVALAVALGIAVSAQDRALRAGSAHAAAGFPLIVGAPGSETQLVLSTVYLQPAAIGLVPPAVLAELQQTRTAKLVAPIGFGDSWRGHPVVGVTADFVRHLGGGAPAEGVPFGRIDEAVAGADVPLALGDGLQPTHGTAGPRPTDSHPFTYRVVGRLPRLGNPWDRAILVPIEAVWWIHSLPVGHVLDEVLLYPDGPDGDPDWSAIPLGPPWAEGELAGVPALVVAPSSPAAGYQLRQRYRGQGETTAVFPSEVLLKLYRTLGDVRDLVAAISFLTQVLVLGAVLLAVLAGLAQRRRRIAVLRALGASRGYVFAALWLGVALVLVVGSLLGLVLGYLAARYLSHLFAARTALTLPVTLSASELLLLLAIILVGLLLAMVPAALGYRAPVAANLRG